MMKNAFLIIFAAVGIVTCFASCKTNTNDLPNNNTYVNQASNARLPNNGEVTDGNGIIGDSDDLVYKTNKIGNTVNNAVHNAGDIVNNAAHNAGDVVNNTADKIGDTVQNITDNVGDTVKKATR